MTRARDLADVISGQFDVPAGSLDNAPSGDIVDDTTPQLGGNLDVQTHSIVSVSNQDIAITPNGTGSIVLDGLNWPQADGSAGQLLKTDGSGQLSFVDDAGGMDWSDAPKTASFTAVAGKGYFVDTSSSAITVTLPASPSTGDRVAIIDYKSNANNNNITVEDNSSKFKGETVDFVTLSTAGIGIMYIYSDTAQGWVTFLSDTDGDSVVTYPSYTVDALLVAGGGGGSSGTGSGGSGGGGFLEGTLTFRQNTVYTVTVGAGGAGSTRNPNANSIGSKGGNSSITGSDITSAIADAGGVGSMNGTVGLDGGSGGGGGGADINGTGRNGTDATQGNSGGLTGYGFDGADGRGYSSYTGAGGGGAGAAGTNGATNNAGEGGNGRTYSLDSTTYAGGGGGGSETGSAGTGGTGGGGNGTLVNGSNSSSGGANTGGGAGGSGGGSSSNNNDGGSGIVKLRILTSDYSGTTTGSPTVTTSGSYTILTYTGSGSYTA